MSGKSKVTVIAGCTITVADVWLAQHWDVKMGVYVKRAKLVLALLSVFALGACSTPQEAPEPAPSTTAAPASQKAAETTPAETDLSLCNDVECAPNNGLFEVDGKFEFTSSDGATGKFTFDDKPPADVEALRKAVGAKPVHYMTVEVDNRGGSDDAGVYGVAGYDPDGKKYEYLGLEETLDGWRENVDSDKATDLYNKFVDAINEQLVSVDVSEVSTVNLAYEGKLPEGFTRVAVDTGDYDAEDAYLEGQELPADDFQESYDSVEKCVEDFAAVNAEVDGGSVESWQADPELNEICERIVADDYSE